jgi:hypothetical protein
MSNKSIQQSVQDAGYIAVGVGVLGVQAAQGRRREAQTQLEGAARDVKSAVETAANQVRERVEPVIAGVRERVEPVVDQIEDKAREVIETGSAKAKVFLRREVKAKPVAKTSAKVA